MSHTALVFVIATDLPKLYEYCGLTAKRLK